MTNATKLKRMLRLKLNFIALFFLVNLTIPCTLSYVQISLKINIKQQYSCNKSQSRRQMEFNNILKTRKSMAFFCIESSKWNSFISVKQSDFGCDHCAIQIKHKFTIK